MTRKKLLIKIMFMIASMHLFGISIGYVIGTNGNYEGSFPYMIAAIVLSFITLFIGDNK